MIIFAGDTEILAAYGSLHFLDHFCFSSSHTDFGTCSSNYGGFIHKMLNCITNSLEKTTKNQNGKNVLCHPWMQGTRDG